MSELRSQRSGPRHVFISYSRDDREFITSMEHALSQAGLVVWNDQQVAPGLDWVSGIEKAIEKCDIAIVVLSNHSVQATTTNYELGLLLRKAEQESLRIIPVAIGTLSRSDIPPRLHRYAILDGRTKSPDQFLVELVAVLSSL